MQSIGTAPPIGLPTECVLTVDPNTQELIIKAVATDPVLKIGSAYAQMTLVGIKSQLISHNMEAELRIPLQDKTTV